MYTTENMLIFVVVVVSWFSLSAFYALGYMKVTHSLSKSSEYKTGIICYFILWNFIVSILLVFLTQGMYLMYIYAIVDSVSQYLRPYKAGGNAPIFIPWMVTVLGHCMLLNFIGTGVLLISQQLCEAIKK